ncbi:type II toxin-antitoxin system VapC family toxin [Mucilaginibacter sp. BJC16-A38]|uniref:type II toxin-antitoxin system VapC family toxin n=1 Tax=Mucilaginibacter phenanthrenivorans TaxID=1234842 RepID=UPI0021572673|nr:type II toxin-antitoxin system VapC family toxin [Mucilaginibacter phenanthrenivorans]MCR8557039.1 type II toxin-antitoxin system VapC family toxin [Mucilaginibacter phenanthrenivorans]
MVVDTGILIEHLRAKNKLATSLYLIPDDSELFISTISLYELYMGATTSEKEKDAEDLAADFSILPFTAAAAVKAAEIYRQLKKTNKLIEFRDIFIAATCIVNDLPVATLNKKHFERIEGLNVANIQ